MDFIEKIYSFGILRKKLIKMIKRKKSYKVDKERRFLIGHFQDPLGHGRGSDKMNQCATHW